MSVVLYRIDDRLVHGQVMVAWSKIYQSTRIFVIDDNTANNPFLSNVMKMAMPGDYDLHILSAAEAPGAIASDPPDKKTMTLVKSPKTIMDLLEAGTAIKELNVGNIGAGKGRKPALKNIQLSPEEYDTLEAIQAKGVRVFFQIFPDSGAVDLSKINYKR
jgi:PTS system mannose-specific IIB component